MTAFEVQGHRGAGGLASENTLPSFEAALDCFVTSIETDLHLSKDDHPVLMHDAEITPRLCASPAAARMPRIRSLSLAELRCFRIGSPCEPPAPLALAFANERGWIPFGVVALADLFDFVKAYAGETGAATGKTPAQRLAASRVILDLELKRVPFRPENIGDDFDGTKPGTLERRVVDAILQANMPHRARVRSFDHRAIVAIRQLESRISTAALAWHTAPCNIAAILEATGADLYCSDYQFVDADIVNQVQRAGKRIIPYTVNELDDWKRLVEWHVDGITTDYPDRLNAFLERLPGAGHP